MPLDASIFGQARPTQINPTNALMQALQIHGQARQNALADSQISEQQATVEERSRLRNALMGGARPDTPEGLNALVQVAPNLAPQIGKAYADMRQANAKAGAEEASAGKTAQETRTAAIQQHLQQIPLLKSPQLAQQWLAAAVPTGALTQQQATYFMQNMPQDGAQVPQYLQGLQQAGLTNLQQIELRKPVLGGQNLGGSFQYTARDPMTGAVTVNGNAPMTMTPGEVASNSLGYARLAQEKQGVEYADDANGNKVSLPKYAAPGSMIKAGAVVAPGPGMVPLPGKPQTLNDSQAKSYLFGDRMRAADQIIADMAMKGVSREGNIYAGAAATPIIGGALGAIANGTQSAGQQKVLQAKRDFMTAALRRESGASIAPSEFETFDKTYFPQIGDKPPVIAEKAALRQRAIDGVLIEVPKNQRPTGVSPSPSPGAVLKFDAQGNLLP